MLLLKIFVKKKNKLVKCGKFETFKDKNLSSWMLKVL